MHKTFAHKNVFLSIKTKYLASAFQVQFFVLELNLLFCLNLIKLIKSLIILNCIAENHSQDFVSFQQSHSLNNQ